MTAPPTIPQPSSDAFIKLSSAEEPVNVDELIRNATAMLVRSVSHRFELKREYNPCRSRELEDEAVKWATILNGLYAVRNGGKR